jgi:hypothetical protein
MRRSSDEAVNVVLPALLRAAIAAVCLSCSGAATDEPPTAEPETGAASAWDPSVPVVGSFAINLVAPTSSTDGFTSLLGRVYDAPRPPDLAWEIADEALGCELRVPMVPFCDPGCDTSAVCTPEAVCVPYPKAQDLGMVTVSGLDASAIEMLAISATYQLPPAIELPHPPTEEGAAIRLQTGGGAYAPFAISSIGIAPLQLSGPAEIPLDGSAPLTLQWEPPSKAGASRIQVKVDISHHGGLKGVIECDVEDDGESVIEASLIAQLIGLGAAGFPSINVTRVATGGAKIDPGNVLLTVSSRVERALEIAGVVSCNDDDDCGADQSCATNRTCQGP